MGFANFSKLQIDNLVLNKIGQEDRAFIESMFNDADIRKYYIVPKEAQQDFKKLIGYWMHDIQNEAGYAWVITQKGSGIFQPDKKCGFVAFEFRNSTSNARISYALLPQFRNKGIIGKSLQCLLELLKGIGVQTVEADIDRDNIKSEKVVEKLGFIADKRKALVDPEMMREGEIRFRALWQKELTDYSKAGFYVVKNSDFSKIFNSQTMFKVDEEPAPSEGFSPFMQYMQPKTTGRYYMVITSEITEKVVGLSSNESKSYRVPWELKREEQFGGNKFLVFSGWGDPMNGGHFQFEGHEIGIDKKLFANIIAQLMSNNPDYFSIKKMQKLVGLEGFKIENGNIYI